MIGLSPKNKRLKPMKIPSATTPQITFKRFPPIKFPPRNKPTEKGQETRSNEINYIRGKYETNIRTSSIFIC